MKFHYFNILQRIFPVFCFVFLDKPVVLTNLVHPTTKLLAMNTEPSVAVVLTKAMHRTPNTEHRTPNSVSAYAEITNRLHLVLTFLFICNTMLFFSQNRQDYYIEIDSLHTFNILSTTVNQDETLTFELDSNSNFEDFLNSQDIYSFEKAYPTAVTPRLQRFYIMSVDENASVNDFLSRNEVFLVEPFEEEVINLDPDLSLVYYPDDFMDYFEDFPNSELVLIRAPWAWTVTKGNPNILVGVRDTKFDLNHEDLIGKVDFYLNFGNHPQFHGTQMASIASSATNNGKGTASIGYNTRLALASGSSFMNGLLVLSQLPGVKVVNCSWGVSCFPITNHQLVIQEITKSGVLIVASAGNGPGHGCGDGHGYQYPASYDEVLSVTSVGNRYSIGYHHNLISPINNQVYGDRSWMDVHLLKPHDPNSTSSHTHNDKVNVSAPGHLVVSATDNYDDYPSGYRVGTGTSGSAAMTSGLAALVFAANPDLTAAEVKDIIESTTDNIYHIPYNQPYIGLLGTGRINAFRAVMKAHCMTPGASINPQLDLLVRNSLNDFGIEPDVETGQAYWNSPDIWVRNQQDGTYIFDHQNPEYSPTNPNYIYVRVTNKGCVTSSGNDVLELYWAKANTSLNWPDYWDGSIVVNGVPMGGQIIPAFIPSIPVLEPGQEAILEIPWMVPDPDDYIGINQNPWHFCLLARIVSDDDPMSYTEVASIAQNVKNNNNLGWKNTTIVDLIPDLISHKGGVVGVSNPFNESKTFKLEFYAEPNENGKPIYEEAEVGVVLDSLLMASWYAGGSQGSNYVSPTASNPKFIATDDNMVIDNLTLPAGAYTTMDVNFNFLINELTPKRKFTYHVVLKEASTGTVIGGETYIIYKQPRPTFDALAGDNETIDKNQSVTLYADPINENAVYNWYDPDGNLIYTGLDPTVSPMITTTYKLEVITETDGFKDYDVVTVNVNPYQIQSMVPNPASSEVTINYDVEGATSAYIMMVNQTTGNSDNYILDIEEASVTINTSAYPTGLYSVILVVNGDIQSSKNLLIQ